MREDGKDRKERRRKEERMTKRSEHLRENRRKKGQCPLGSRRTSFLLSLLSHFEVPYILPRGIRALPLHRTFAKKLFIGAVS